MSEPVIQLSAPPTHCSQCGAEYRNIQHPMKPLGVTIMSVCDCVVETRTIGTTTITTVTPSRKST